MTIMTNDSVMFRGSEFKNRLKEIAYLYIIYILYINMTKIEHILKMSRTNHDCHNCHICHHLLKLTVNTSVTTLYKGRFLKTCFFACLF